MGGSKAAWWVGGGLLAGAVLALLFSYRHPVYGPYPSQPAQAAAANAWPMGALVHIPCG